MNFSNPIPITQTTANTLGLDFTTFVDANDVVTEEPVLTPDIKTEEEPPESNLSELLKEEGQEEEKTEESSPWTTQINFLADKGFITEAYEGFDDTKDADEETFLKLLEYNVDKRVDEGITDLFSRLSDEGKRVLEFDLNSKNKGEVRGFLNTLVEEQNIKSLDVENEYDQEKILREWFRNKEGFSQQEIDKKISTYKDKGILKEEAEIIKPKLDQEAEKIAKRKEEEASALRKLETTVNQGFSEKLVKTLEKGKIKDISVKKEDLQTIYTVLTGGEIEMSIRGGRKVMMNPLDAVIFHNKFDKNGSLENLALATLLLVNPKKFEEAYSKKAQTKETEQFIKEHKYNNKFKKSEPTEQPKSKYTWGKVV